MIRRRKDGWFLLSHDGSKVLGGPYKNRTQAVKREKEVQFFKHNRNRVGG